jgi:hypothetical protein
MAYIYRTPAQWHMILSFRAPADFISVQFDIKFDV